MTKYTVLCAALILGMVATQDSSTKIVKKVFANKKKPKVVTNNKYKEKQIVSEKDFDEIRQQLANITQKIEENKAKIEEQVNIIKLQKSNLNAQKERIDLLESNREFQENTIQNLKEEANNDEPYSLENLKSLMEILSLDEKLKPNNGSWICTALLKGGEAVVDLEAMLARDLESIQPAHQIQKRFLSRLPFGGIVSKLFGNDKSDKANTDKFGQDTTEDGEPVKEPFGSNTEFDQKLSIDEARGHVDQGLYENNEEYDEMNEMEAESKWGDWGSSWKDKWGGGWGSDWKSKSKGGLDKKWNGNWGGDKEEGTYGGKMDKNGGRGRLGGDTRRRERRVKSVMMKRIFYTYLLNYCNKPITT